MTNYRFSFLLITCFALTLWACSKSAEDSDSGDTPEEQETSSSDAGQNDASSGEPKNLAEAMEQVNKMMGEQGNSDVEIINFRELKEMLPQKAAGLERQNAGGETAGFGGFKVSTANGEYSDADGKKTLEIEITDTGKIPMAVTGLAAFANVDIDRENDNGFERTTKFEGFPAYEKYTNAGERSEFSVFVNNRFVVSAEGRGLTMDEVKKGLKEVGLKKLGNK